jgi:N-acetylglucosaminyldiphosphoundecaprenol N-acetyl-beta-D-mannosaminyltransferase
MDGDLGTLAERVRIADYMFDKVTMSQAIDRVVEMARAKDRPRYVCTGNLDHLFLLDRDAEFASVYRGADLVVADGAPVVWLSRLVRETDGGALPERVAGSDMFWELARASAETGIRLFFLGGVTGAAATAATAAERRYPGAKIVGTYCPPFETFDTEEEQRRIRDVVRSAKPDVLLVAFGAPKQEKWIAKNKAALGVPVSIGVGGSFEMAAGIKQRAPAWVQRLGMEWLYRFGQEPRRLFDRYFMKDLPHFLSLALRTAAERARRRPSRLPG